MLFFHIWTLQAILTSCTRKKAYNILKTQSTKILKITNWDNRPMRQIYSKFTENYVKKDQNNFVEVRDIIRVPLSSTLTRFNIFFSCLFFLLDIYMDSEKLQKKLSRKVCAVFVLFKYVWPFCYHQALKGYVCYGNRLNTMRGNTSVKNSIKDARETDKICPERFFQICVKEVRRQGSFYQGKRYKLFQGASLSIYQHYFNFQQWPSIKVCCAVICILALEVPRT